MFDMPIALALFAAFLLGVVAGSGVEIIVRGGRHSDSWLNCRVLRRTPPCGLSPGPPERPRQHTWRELRARSPRRIY